MNYQVIIVGGGAAGISALLWCHSLGLSALMLDQASELGGQMLQMRHPTLEYPGFPDKTGAELRDAFVAHLQNYQLQWRLNCQLQSVNFQEKYLLAGDERFDFQALILATGASTRTLGLPNEAEFTSYSALEDQEKLAGKSVCVIGGGDSAVEDSLILAEICPEVILIHRSDQFRSRKTWLEQAQAHPRITIRTHTEINSVKQFPQHLSLTIQELHSHELEELLVGGFVVRLGIKPNSEIFGEQLTLDQSGYIVTNQAQQTSVENIYAVGDVCRPVCFSIATAIGHGAIAAKDIAEKFREGE
jgi:thioredoxin reductase (NADPH)